MGDITCVCRDDDGDITHIGVEKTLIGADGTTLWSVEQAYDATRRGAQFQVYHNGAVRKIEPRTHPETGKRYLVTLPDQQLLNNLDFLDECATCS